MIATWQGFQQAWNSFGKKVLLNDGLADQAYKNKTVFFTKQTLMIIHVNGISCLSKQIFTLPRDIVDYHWCWNNQAILPVPEWLTWKCVWINRMVLPYPDGRQNADGKHQPYLFPVYPAINGSMSPYYKLAKVCMDPDCAFCRPSHDVRNYRINDALVNGADTLCGMASFNFPVCCHFLVIHSAWYDFITSADSYWIIQCGDYTTRTVNADISEYIRNGMLWRLRLALVEYFIHTSASTSKGWRGVHSVCIIEYTPKNMRTVFALLCFVVVIHWLIFPYPSGLLHWHCGNLTIAPVPAKQPWWIWINTSCEFIMNDCITTTKQSTTKPCAYFLGYTVFAFTYPCPSPQAGLLVPKNVAIGQWKKKCLNLVNVNHENILTDRDMVWRNSSS